jgi:hypothetical protein
MGHECDDSGLDDRNREFAAWFGTLASEAETRAPVHAALCRGVSADPDIAGLLSYAPPTQQLSVLLMAAIHFVLIGSPDAHLGAWYPNIARRHGVAPRPIDDEPALRAALHDFVDEHRDRLIELVSTRSTQTNEVGRCALFLPAFGIVEAEVGPFAHLDVGASGGLNLNLDRYDYVYEPGGTVRSMNDDEGDAGSSVVLTCGTRGDVPLARRVPTIVARCGIDLSPIDLADDDEARWLEACVWPDQLDRFDRLVAAIDIARRHPVEVVAGDAVELLAAQVGRLANDAHPVITNSWVLSYFTAERRADYVAELDRMGSRQDLTWVFAESPAHAPGLPVPPDRADATGTELTMVRWRSGARTVEHLASCHPHGYWLHWGGHRSAVAPAFTAAGTATACRRPSSGRCADPLAGGLVGRRRRRGSSHGSPDQ